MELAGDTVDMMVFPELLSAWKPLRAFPMVPGAKGGGRVALKRSSLSLWRIGPRLFNEAFNGRERCCLSTLFWPGSGTAPLRSAESIIVAAGSGSRGLCQFFVLKDKATFSLTLAEASDDHRKTHWALRCKRKTTRQPCTVLRHPKYSSKL